MGVVTRSLLVAADVKPMASRFRDGLALRTSLNQHGDKLLIVAVQSLPPRRSEQSLRNVKVIREVGRRALPALPKALDLLLNHGNGDTTTIGQGRHAGYTAV